MAASGIAKTYKDVKSYRRRKRWLWYPFAFNQQQLVSPTISNKSGNILCWSV